MAGRDRGVRDLGGLDRRSIDRSGFVPALGSCGAGRHFAAPVKAACASARGNNGEIEDAANPRSIERG
jgi:hypothetical protein